MVATTILFFGKLGDAFGRERDVDMPEQGCSVGELREILEDTLAADAGLLRDPSIKVCVDRAIVSDGTKVRPGQEIAFLPPLSGG